jgi:hypothetical protein
MVLLSIGFSSENCNIYNKLVELTGCFKEKGVSIGLVETDNDDIHFIKCVIKDEGGSSCNISEIKSSFDIYTANIIYQVLVDSFQKNIISKIVKDNYNYFHVEEAFDIVDRCMGILNGTVKMQNTDFYYISRKEKAVKKSYE